MKPIEAARVLYQNSSTDEAQGILEHLWNSPDRSPSDEFSIFCALVEVWAHKSRQSVFNFLESVISGEGELQPFWERRTMPEQATMLEWHGQFAFAGADFGAAFSSLTRAASLGRDTAIIWRLIGVIHIEHQELELGMRYIRRSLQLHRQLELDLLSGRDNPLGFFTGKHPLNFTQNADDFLKILLDVTRLAKGQRSLRSVRELVVEMIHQNPGDDRLMKIRLLLEKAIVQNSLVPGTTQNQRALAPAQPQAIANPKGLSALFRP